MVKPAQWPLEGALLILEGPSTTQARSSSQTNRQRNRQTDKQTNRQTDKQTNSQTDRQTYKPTKQTKSLFILAGLSTTQALSSSLSSLFFTISNLCMCGWQFCDKLCWSCLWIDHRKACTCVLYLNALYLYKCVWVCAWSGILDSVTFLWPGVLQVWTKLREQGGRTSSTVGRR